MKGISNKEFNKIVAKVDRVFTWESRHIYEDGGKSAHFHCYDEYQNHTSVHIVKSKYGVYGSYRTVRNGRVLRYSKLLESFAEIRDFVERVELIG